MEKIVEIGDLRFGSGLPKLCVSVGSEGELALREELGWVAALPADLFEWRVDCYCGSPLEVLPLVCQSLAPRPVLCTVRTRGEGGQADLSPRDYEDLVTALLERGGFSLVDIELSCGEDRVRRLLALAREKGLGTVVSRHCFTHTPSRREMEDTLLEMKVLGADLPKLAVMPQSPRDVLDLMQATLDASQKIGPVITMAMGELGKLSRVSGALTGSCLTFGAGKQASAPGQLEAEDLLAVLQDLQPLCGEMCDPRKELP